MKESIRREWNAPPQFSVKHQRWQPRMSTAQDMALKSIAQAHPNWPFHWIDGRTLASLRKRGWVQDKAPLLTSLGVRVVEEFWPSYLKGSDDDNRKEVIARP